MKSGLSDFRFISEPDRNFIENKYHRQDMPFNGQTRMKYHGYAYDESTGLSDEEIIAGLSRLAGELSGEHHYKIKSELF